MSKLESSPSSTVRAAVPPGQVIAAGVLIVIGGVLLGVPLVALGGAAVFVVGLVAKGVEIGMRSTRTSEAAPRPVASPRSDWKSTATIALTISGFVMMLAAGTARDLAQAIPVVGVGAAVALLGLGLWVFRGQSS